MCFQDGSSLNEDDVQACSCTWWERHISLDDLSTCKMTSSYDALLEVPCGQAILHDLKFRSSCSVLSDLLQVTGYVLARCIDNKESSHLQCHELYDD